MHDQQHFDSRLLNFARGAQDPQLEDHIISCKSCQELAFTLKQLVHYQTTTGGGLIEPPPALMSELTGLLAKVRPELPADRAQTASDLVKRVRSVVAGLILDTRATPQLAGLRGESGSRTWQLAFVSDLADLDLEVSLQEAAYSVAGQLGMDNVPAGLRIRFVPADQDPLADDAQGAVEAEIQEQGYFSVALPASEWVAMVEINDAVVLFPGVRL